MGACGDMGTYISRHEYGSELLPLLSARLLVPHSSHDLFSLFFFLFFWFAAEGLCDVLDSFTGSTTTEVEIWAVG